MANNVTVLIRQEMAKLQKQYNALSEALKVLEGASSPAIATAAKSSSTAPSGKRGRPKGSKKSKAKKVATTASAAASVAAPQPKAKPTAKPVAGSSASRPAKKAKKGAPKGKRKQRGINLNGAIREYIVSANRFVLSSELAEKFNAYYPEKTRADFGKYMSVLLSIAKAGKKLAATTLDKNGAESRASFWGLPEWFENGRGKAAYYK